MSHPFVINKKGIFSYTLFLPVSNALFVHLYKSQSSVRKGATINLEGVERLHSGLSAQA